MMWWWTGATWAPRCFRTRRSRSSSSPTPWERARRRLSQRLGRRPSDEEVAEETDLIVQRDSRDATQTVQAKDAVLLDTTYLTQPEQVERIVALAHAVSHRPSVT
jgi:cytidylate kinase